MSASREKQKRKEEFELGISKDQMKELEVKKEKKRRKRSIIVIVAVLVIAIGAFCVFTDNIPFFSGRLLKEGTALEIGNTSYSAADFNYYYYNTAAQYESSYQDYFSMLGIESGDAFLDSEYTDGQTWGDYIKDYTIDQLKQQAYLLDAAAEEGYTLTDEELAEMDTYFTSLSSYASSLDMDVNEYYESQFGTGVTEEIYRRNMERSTLASNYAAYVKARFGDAYTDEDLQGYYDEHVDDIDTVDYNYFFMSAIVASGDDTTQEDALTQAYADSEAFVQRLADGESYYDLAYEYARDISKDRYKDNEFASHRRGVVKASVIADIREWLFDSSRKEGDVTIIEGNPDDTYTGYFVVEFLGRERAEYETVNYRNILINVSVDDEETYAESTTSGVTTGSEKLPYDDYVEQQWASAETSVNSLVDKWNTEGGDEDAFAALAISSSSDTNTSSNGGLNSNAYRYQTDEAINDWLFNEPRQAGDYEVFEVDSGYQIVYFSGYGDIRWKQQTRDALSTADYDEWFATFDAEPSEKFCMRYAMK